MSAIERVEKYLDERNKMRNHKDAWIHWLNSGSENEAALKAEDIRQLLQQRAELLEALKEVLESTVDSTYGNPTYTATQKAHKAIQKAEK